MESIPPEFILKMSHRFRLFLISMNLVRDFFFKTGLPLHASRFQSNTKFKSPSGIFLSEMLPISPVIFFKVSNVSIFSDSLFEL